MLFTYIEAQHPLSLIVLVGASGMGKTSATLGACKAADRFCDVVDLFDAPSNQEAFFNLLSRHMRPCHGRVVLMRGADALKEKQARAFVCYFTTRVFPRPRLCNHAVVNVSSTACPLVRAIRAAGDLCSDPRNISFIYLHPPQPIDLSQALEEYKMDPEVKERFVARGASDFRTLALQANLGHKWAHMDVASHQRLDPFALVPAAWQGIRDELEPMVLDTIEQRKALSSSLAAMVGGTGCALEVFQENFVRAGVRLTPQELENIATALSDAEMLSQWRIDDAARGEEMYMAGNFAAEIMVNLSVAHRRRMQPLRVGARAFEWNKVRSVYAANLETLRHDRLNQDACTDPAKMLELPVFSPE